MSRLKESIKVDVLVGRPLDLTTAIWLARLFEARNNSLRRPPVTSQTMTRTNLITSKEEGGSRSPMPIRRLSPVELKERRDKGLCYNCNEKFAHGHRCKKLFLIEAYTTEEHGDVSMELELEEEQETPGISLHAISGDHAPETMKVSGKIGLVPAMVLLDSGSSHNFISESLAQKLVLQPAQEKKIRVMVASEERLTSKGRCFGVTIKLGSYVTQADFYILPLEGYDVVMGTHWLRTLGEILWDFAKLTMKFMSKGKEIILKGLFDRWVDGHELEKHTGKQPKGAILHLVATTLSDTLAREEKRKARIVTTFGSFQRNFQGMQRLAT